MSNNEPLCPEWPINVMVFKPTDDVNEIKERIKPTEDPIGNNDVVVDNRTSDNHFSTKHYALLFAPGEYKDCQFEVGYYVGMAGLGKVAKGEGSVRFTGEKSGPFVPALNKDMLETKGGSIPYDNSGLCLDTFWRSAANYSAENTQWAVSQAAPLRRVHISKDLSFGDGPAYSSGGFLANAEVEGKCNYIANQQWYTRNVDFKGTVEGGAWSIVFSGCTGDVPENNSKTPNGPVHTVEDEVAVRIEQPFIVLNPEGNYELHVPKQTTKSTGATLDDSDTEIRSFSGVKVAKPYLPLDADNNYIDHDDATYNKISERDTAITNELQKALDEGKDLVLCPGLFFLTAPLEVKFPNQVILGIGLATLIAPKDGSPCIRVKAKVPGVRIAALMLEASLQDDTSDSPNKNSDGVMSLIDFGEPHVTDDVGDPSNHGLLSDIFTRVGGSNLEREKVMTDVMVRVHSGHVVGDNLWLWRADHVRLREGEIANVPNFPRYHQVRIWNKVTKQRIDECYVKNALVVDGDDVKMYGLFCEHTCEHQMVWKGERGSVSFFQCELPYDVDVDYADDNYCGYFVHKDIKEHVARGVGVYTNFQEYDVHVPSAIQLPFGKGIILQNPFARHLQNEGGLKNVVDVSGFRIGGGVSKSSKHSNGWIGGDKFRIVALGDMK